MTVAGDTLFFVADDGVTGRELWKTDGTEGGTILVRDINEGPENSGVSYLTDVAGVLLFSAGTRTDDGTLNRALWRSDGTAAGTEMVKDIYITSPDMTAIGSTAYFSGRGESTGIELWKTDGTEEGTTLVRDIDLDDSSFPDELTSCNGILYFVAYDPLYSRELFRSDGTYLGTELVYDVRPGGDPSVEVDVTFTPTAAGPAAGLMDVMADENSVIAMLHGTGVAPEPTPPELMAELLFSFDAAVADGSLQGSGPAASAAGRLGALRNMLVTAQTLIDAGDIEAACTQLFDAYQRTDGEPIPPDFVEGDAAPLVAAMIADLRGLLECE
jgi:ELWxxDGT repeat protein